MTMLSITPDQMAAAGSYIARSWGDFGYSIEKIESPTNRVSLFHVVASDGSRFIVAADRYGNCRYADSHGYKAPAREAAVSAMVVEMHKAAAAS
jgi:hypothetical protein